MKKIGTVAALLLATALLGTSLVTAQQAATPPAPAPAGPSPMGNVPDLFSSTCAGCHGNDLSGGRGPSLFAENLLSETSDATLLHTIREGIPDGGMPSFKGQLSDADIGQLIAYLRIRGAQLKGRPSFLPDPNGQIVKSEKQTFKIDVVAANLETPWGEVFLPDGRMLVTERGARDIRIIDHGKLLPDPVKGTPQAWARQDGGYFDIAIHPDYKHNGWIYLSFTDVAPGVAVPPPDDPNAPRSSLPAAPPNLTRVVRGRINAKNEWVDQQDIFHGSADLYTTSVIHYGSRFLFDGKGHLFWSLGDRGDKSNGQNLASPLGKVHRVNDDGSVPADNPFVHTQGADPSVWSYGHRNPEGLTFDPKTGLLWESEHGPTGGDEVNVIEKGHNYGWGAISMGLEPGITEQHHAGMEDPITYYTPAIGPSGMNFYTGSRYSGWKYSLFLSALAGQKLIRFEIKDRQITHQEIVYQGFGRTRDVITGPDGYLYILLQNSQALASSPGMVIRLLPAN
jgi:glucose/arabinose dehydrogenase